MTTRMMLKDAPDERRPAAELIACIEAGAVARTAGADHGDNPHLVTLRNGVESPESALVMERASAWWDGWEEADRALSPDRIWREDITH